MTTLKPIVLKKPHLSEKSTDLRVLGQYIFDVENGINKNTIKQAIEDYYHVDVIKVRMIKSPSKPKSWMRKVSHVQSKKKAIVTIKEGQKIELGV
jgi:large subunit ribosomal protein L23